MSRSGYQEDIDQRDLIRWRGQVASATRGKRGQTLLRDLLEALDAMPVKELVEGDLETTEGAVCALGALGKVRGIDMQKLDPEDADQVAEAFDIAAPLAQEIVFENDEQCSRDTPEERWKYMREWVAKRITPIAALSPPDSGTQNGEKPND